MNIIIINGSPRKSGRTATILNEIYSHLKTKPFVNVQMIHLSEITLNFCTGCCHCYKTGLCIFKDDIESISLQIATSDGVILGSPTYASNVSSQMKLLIDRGHFVMEQLLYGKYAMSVATYENYGGKDTANILNKLFTYSGATISGTIVSKAPYSVQAKNDLSLPLRHSICKKADKFYNDIFYKRKYRLQRIKHSILFHLGIYPFVTKKGDSYLGVKEHWKKRNIFKSL